jgi:hypothetical protein
MSALADNRKCQRSLTFIGYHIDHIEGCLPALGLTQPGSPRWAVLYGLKLLMACSSPKSQK